MKFVNDPQFDDVPPVGALSGLLVAPRALCGEAFRWVPGGDAKALVALWGETELAWVGGQVYRRLQDRSLVPFDTSKPFVVVIPPAGDPFTISDNHLFTSQMASLASSLIYDPVFPPGFKGILATMVSPDADVAETSEVTPVVDGPEQTQVAVATGVAAIGDVIDLTAHAPKPKGRPPGSKNKPKDAA